MLGIQSEEAAYHLQKSQLVTNLPVFVFLQIVEGGNKACGLSSHGADQVHRQQQSLEDSEREESMETSEFVAGVSYTCMIVITNVSPIHLVVEVMDQIPRGSYPLSNLKSLVNEVKTIDAFSTCTMSYSFVYSISRRWETLNIFQHTLSIQRRRPSSLSLLLPSFIMLISFSTFITLSSSNALITESSGLEGAIYKNNMLIVKSEVDECEDSAHSSHIADGQSFG